MSTVIVPPSASASPTSPLKRTSLARRVIGVAAQPQSYRNIGYLLLGLPLGTAWFTVLVTGISVSISMLAVALLGIPMLLGVWYLARAFANVERITANVLLGQHLALAPMTSHDRGNLWVRLRSMSSDRARWREFGYLVLRFPAGVATFTVAVVALATPVIVAYAPFAARYEGEHPFGDWSLSGRLEDVATSSPWSWLLVPLGVVLLVASLHLMSALAHACARWAAASLGAAGALHGNPGPFGLKLGAPPADADGASARRQSTR